MSSKHSFLSNPGNKERFVDLLSEALESHGIRVARCLMDAYVRIVSTVIDSAKVGEDVLLWRDDTDLLVLLLHHISITRNCGSVSMYRPSSNTCIFVSDLVSKMDNTILQTILPLHALSGCDTASSLHGIGKTKLMKLMEKNSSSLLPVLRLFYRQPVCHDQLVEAGNKIISTLYDSSVKGISTAKDLKTLRIW